MANTKMNDILSAFNKIKESQQVNLLSEVLPENSGWKYMNGRNDTDGWVIGDEIIKNALSAIGVDKDTINDILLEPVDTRELWLDYFETR